MSTEAAKKVAFHINSSHGESNVDEEGMPLTVLPTYEHIVRFDVEEYRSWAKKTWPNEKQDELMEVDIIEIGFWWMDGTEKKYSEPDHFYRKRLEDGQRVVFASEEDIKKLMKS